jgi:hypothetical protein
MMRNKHFYHKDWPEISRKFRERKGWQCERCGIKQGAERLSRKGNLYKVIVMACHEDHSQRHRADADLICLCCVCHWWRDFEAYQLDEWRKLERMKHQRLLTPQRIADMYVRVFNRAQKRFRVHLEQERVEQEREALYG